MGQVGLIRKLRKLSGCDPDFNRSHVLWKKTLASDKQVNLGPGECTEPSLVWNQLTTLSCFEACGVQRFHSQQFCVWDQFCILKKSIALFHIWFFLLLHNILKKTLACGSQAGHMWITSGLLSVSTGVTHFQPYNQGIINWVTTAITYNCIFCIVRISFLTQLVLDMLS